MHIFRRMRHNNFAVVQAIAAQFRRKAAGKGEFAAMGRKWIKLLVPVALAALLLTGCSFRGNDTSSDNPSSTASATGSTILPGNPYSSYTESDWGDTYSSVLSDGNSLGSAIQSEIMPDRNDSSSGHASR